MENNIIKEEIIELLETIIEQSEAISVYNGQVPQIEIDIVLSNIRELYEKYKTFDKFNKQISHSSTKDARVNTAIEENQVKEKKNEEKTSIVEEKIQKKEETIIIAKTPSQTALPLDETKSEKATELTQKKVKKSPIDLFSAHTTIADNLKKDEKKSLNEKLSLSQTDKSIALKLKKNPIKDLKSAIGINEKFKFINELFEGNLQKYNEGLVKLNGFADYEEAAKYLLILKEESGWEDRNEAYLLLSELVTRRYL